MDTRLLRDSMMPKDRIMAHMGQQRGKLARGVLYRDNGVDQFGRTIFTKVAENTVVLGGAIAALERLANVESSFRPFTLNDQMNINTGYVYHLNATPIALFGCGLGGAGLTYGDVYDPSVKQNNVQQLLPMMVSQNELSGTEADKYMFRTSILTPDRTSLNCWYLKEFDTDPKVVSLWKDAPSEDEDGSEIVEDIADSESENAVESFLQFKLKLNDQDLRSYFEAMGMLPQARFNSIGLYLGEKVMLPQGYYDYVNVSLFSVVNINNEALAERKQITYLYRVYALI